MENSTATQPTQAVTHDTFVIERIYPATPQRIFAAFADPAKKRRWFANRDEAPIEQHEMDFRIGGKERTQGRLGNNTPYPGTSFANDTVYQDIVPDSRIVFAYTMSVGDHRISASLATVELVPDGAGTKVIFTDQGAYFENSDGPERRKQGWSALLEKISTELSR
jgi:uncharacterized protein YndB with AHSA1/START domain